MSITMLRQQAAINRAGAHWIRLRILEILVQSGAAHSPTQLARQAQEPLANISYHTRVLLKLGCVKLVRRVPRRGAVEHYYQVTKRGRKVSMPPKQLS